MIKLCLIGQCLLTRNAYVNAISANESIEFIGDFEQISDCVKFLERQKADAILIDVQMNELGLKLISDLKARCGNVRIVVMTETFEPEYLFKALALGANAFVLKNMTLAKFIDVILSATEGDLFVSSDAVDSITKIFKQRQEKAQKIQECNLTDREQEILGLVAEGKSNSEIGDELALSAFTVKNYVSKIIEKLDVKDRTQATAKAIQYGLVS